MRAEARRRLDGPSLVRWRPIVTYAVATIVTTTAAAVQPPLTGAAGAATDSHTAK